MSSGTHATPAVSIAGHAHTVRAILEALLPPPRSYAVRLWDGTLLPPDPPGTPLFTLVLNRAGALRRMLLPPTDIALGEAFIGGDWDVEGSLEAAFQLAAPLRTWALVHPRVVRLLLTL